MRKKCVRWTKSVLLCLVAITSLSQMLGIAVTAQSTSPSELPRLAFSDVQYVGAFRLPSGMSNGDSFSIGGRNLAFNPAGPSLFVGSRAGRVAEISIPAPVYSANPDALPFAHFLQPLADPTEGSLSQVAVDGVALDGLMVYGNRLYGTASIYYDASNTQRISHFSRSLQLNEPSFSGWSAVWQANKTGFVSGLMAHVPAQWQALLGGPAITGQCCIPIVTRTSWGPAAFAFDPAKVGQSLVPASPLLYYTGEHPTLGAWDATSPTYGASTTMGGMAIIEGTRTALYFGANGIGENCYGSGTGTEALHGTSDGHGGVWCYDPSNSAKGSHAYPYRYQMWAYDLNDFAAVKAGQKQPWEVVPYGVWALDLPTVEPTVRLGGVGYDPATQTLYVSQQYADKDGYAYRALIHTMHVNVPLPVIAPATGVALTSALASPQPSGTAVRFTAAATGGSGTYEYKWLTYDGNAWTASADWTAASELTITPATANANFRVGVRARSAGTTSADGDVSATLDFPITSRRATSVGLTANKTAPQAPGTSIVWTATPVAGEAPHQYKWWLYDGAQWSEMSNWTAASTFTWTPSAGNANYRIAVWVRSAGNTTDHEASNESTFAISAPASSSVSTVSLTSSLPSPQAANTAITWTAAATGGAAPLQYQWWTFDGATWVSQPWTTSNTFAWQPAVANASYRVAVWVRSAGNAGGQEAATEAWYTITAAAVVAPPPPPPPPTARVTAVTLASSLPSPQPANVTISWTAAATGGTAPLQYQWWVFDGATWTPQPWTAANTFAWTPTVAGSNYRVAVWVRSSGNTGGQEAATEAWYTVNAPVVVSPPPPPPPAPTARVTAVTLASTLPSPQPAHVTITWTAVATGGTAPLQYQWWLYDGATWTPQPWTAANTFAWTPTVAGSNYRVAVWVRSNGNAGGQEAATETWFTITTAAAPVPPPPPAPAPVPSVTTSIQLTANLAAPQRPNTTVTWSATPVGGTAPHQYQWWVFDGATWISQPWTTSNTFTWRPTVANDKYRIAVWVRSAGNNGGQETSTEAWFAISGSPLP